MEEPPYSRPEETSYSTQPAVYTRPRMVNDIKDCYFYHTMDLPGLGRIEGDWDLHLNIRSSPECVAGRVFMRSGGDGASRWLSAP